MSVTGSDTKLLFCEGTKRSLDAQLLNRLVDGSGTLIVPVGGKFGFPAFIEGYLGKYDREPPYHGLRDRDFDAEPPDDVELLRWPNKKPIYFTHRACVESYLIDPELIDACWTESAATPAWSHGDSPGVASVAEWIEQSAREIADYQAVRWALANLKPGPRWPQIRTTWTRASGKLPDPLDFDACVTEAVNLVEEFRQSTETVNVKALRESAAHCRERFRVEEFWKRRAYMVWFHGKDLATAMQKEPDFPIPMKHCFSWGVNRLDWEKHPDLAALARKIKS